MTEKEKGLAGELYNPGADEELRRILRECKELCYQYNMTSPLEFEKKDAMLTQLLGKRGEKVDILSPFYCDCGKNISVGERFGANHGLVILDGAAVTFGDDVLVGPGCCFTTAGHPIDAERRNDGLEFARAITVGSSVWLGANVTVLPGVTIGDNCVIGAGSVVTRDIPSGVVAVGNPCRVLRKITDEDSQYIKK